MPTITFDTLKFVKRMEAAGMAGPPRRKHSRKPFVVRRAKSW